MASPLDDLSAGGIATAVVGFGVALLAIWKQFMSMRRDVRKDQDESRTAGASILSDTVHRATIDGMQARLDVLDKVYDELNADAQRERAARREAEERAITADREYRACEQSRQLMKTAIEDCERRSTHSESLAAQLADRVTILEVRLRTINGKP